MEARAVLGIAVGNLYPQQQQAFADVRGIGLSPNTANKPPDFVRNYADELVGFDAAAGKPTSGKFRKTVKAQQAAYMGSVADYQNALVSLSAEAVNGPM